MTASIALLSIGSYAQQLFDISELSSPDEFGDKVAEKLVTTEVYEYNQPTHNCLVLKNGFRKHGFVNAKDWLTIRDSVVVSKVQIVFSKYPMRNGVYKEIYPLLLNRIKATIELDPSLNTSEITWERVWQTHCENNAQVDQLFHGVVIHYDVPEKPTVKGEISPIIEKKVENGIKENIKAASHKKSHKEMSPVLKYMLNHPTTPDALRETAEKLNTEEAEELILTYYREEAKQHEDGPITDPVVQLNYMYELEVFARQFPEADTLVGQILDRHPEWKKKIVVNDWTGSMYGYGSQVLLWHLMHLEQSGISTVTLFNDGDKKTTRQKKIGKTKGIYTEHADNPAALLDLFNLVMSKGAGGDGPENDVEAILEAAKQDSTVEIILIADNSACVRDISLAHQIDRPVRVILCGYNQEEGVNPDYVYLTKITGGGIYTLEDDLEQLNVTIDSDGLLQAFEDERFKLSSPQCFEDVFYAAHGRNYDLKNSRWHKKDVRILDGSNMGLTEVPNYVYKMKNLQSLDLQNNQLAAMNPKLLELEKLSELDLRKNQLSQLPEPLVQLRFIEHLYLDSNRFKALPEGVYQLDFLQEIHAGNNQLSAVQQFDSRVLRIIDLNNNSISEFPELDEQASLEELNLANNLISKAPKSLPENLQIVDLSGNPIELLPDDLTPYTQLKELNLQGTPISTGERIRIRQALFNVDLTF